MRLANSTFRNAAGRWIKVEWVHFNHISYNVSHSVQWVGGRLQCTRAKLKKIIAQGGYERVPASK